MSLLNVGARALMANQVALQTTGHNIANVSTPGYSRQSAQMVTVRGQFTGNGYIGKGVDVQTILRNHSELLTRQAALATSVQASDNARAEKLAQLQDVFTGGKEGIGMAITDMLGSLSDVVNSPMDMTARTVTLTRMAETVARFRTASDRLEEMEYAVNEELKNSVTKINSLTSNIADLNGQIAAATGNGQTPNDLLDQRDRYISELNQYVQTTQIAADDGSISVFVASSQPLVLSNKATPLEAKLTEEFPGANRLSIYYKGSSPGATNLELSIDQVAGGSLAGLMRFANDDLAAGRNQLGRLGQAMAMSINKQNQQGLTLDGLPGQALFGVPSSVGSHPTGAGTVTFNDFNQFAASDYEVRFTGVGQGYVIRLSDNKTTNFNTLTDLAGMQIDGLNFNMTGPGANGERVMFKPFAETTANIKALVFEPDQLAVANPINAAMGATNDGSLQLVSLKATGLIYKDAAAAAAANPPGAIKPENPATNWNLTLEFDGAGGYSVFYPDTTPTAPPGSKVLFATGTYTPGQPISVPNGDWQITVQGTPKNGDTITLGHSLDTAQYGDAYKRDTGNGKAMMELRDAVMFEGTTLQDGWASSIANIGTRTQSAQYAANMSTAIANNLEADRVAVSGVNLDEEAAKLIQYQQAYQASAKMLQIAQGIFDNLLQAVGR